MEYKVLLFLILATHVYSLCDIDWAEYGGECLYFNRNGRRWLDAENECRKLGAFLTSDDNKGKHDFITNIVSIEHELRRDNFWIGGSDYSIEGSWRWLETGFPINPNYTSWMPGAPSRNITLNCMVLSWQGNTLQWKDEDCGHGHYSVCEKPALADPAKPSSPVIGK